MGQECLYSIAILNIELECRPTRIEGYHNYKEGLYRIWCGVNRLGHSGVHTLGDTSASGGSAIVNPAG